MPVDPGKLVAALDIGGTKTAIAIVNTKGNILARSTLQTASFSDPQIFTEAVVNEIKKLKEQTQIKDKLAALGIGAPSGNRKLGTLEYPPNLPWKCVVPLTKYFQNSLQIPCFLDNDANAAAYGEWYFGSARDMSDFIVITLGTGLGSSIVTGGQMIYGHQYLGGEVGHMILIPDGRICGCGRRGCAETYASATAIMLTYQEILSRRSGNNTEKLVAKNPYELKKLAENGDEAARQAFEITGYWLGLILANCCAFTNPQAIFLTGGLAESGQWLMKPTKKSFEKNLLRNYLHNVTLQFSSLPGQNAALLGAASLCWKEIAD